MTTVAIEAEYQVIERVALVLSATNPRQSFDRTNLDELKASICVCLREIPSREVSPEGIKYVAGENAATFLSSLESEYLTALNERAKWLIEAFGSSDEVEFRATMRKLFDHWVEEFQAVESSWGADK